MWHILSNTGYRKVLCGADGNLDRTRASWTTESTRKWEGTCQACAALVTEELIASDEKAQLNHVAKPPRKRNMAVIRKINREAKLEANHP